MAFASKRVFNSSPALIPPLVENLAKQLRIEEYVVSVEPLTTEVIAKPRR